MSFQAHSTEPSSSETTRDPVFPILKLPSEILLMIADEVANADTDDATQCRGRRPKRTLMALSLVNKRLRSVCMERMFKTLSLLRKSEGHNRGLFRFYSGITQGNPMPHIGSFHERFENAPLPPFSKIQIGEALLLRIISHVAPEGCAQFSNALGEAVVSKDRRKFVGFTVPVDAARKLVSSTNTDNVALRLAAAVHPASVARKHSDPRPSVMRTLKVKLLNSELEKVSTASQAIGTDLSKYMEELRMDQ
ncbi:hypothetical protein IWX90DRAFT_482464 [Phyllosticta citrichinensis]|uniref:F-box domain-containing protein n=1 Tax=Phyllosticta citrichinensis TaxID=1130410 RepID=A0ABR1Y783_9PEZI